MAGDHKTILREIRAACERETRINLHRYPIQLSFSAGDLVDLAVGGEIKLA